MEGFQAAARLLPYALEQALGQLPAEERACCEEIRLRQGRTMMVLMNGREFSLPGQTVTGEDLRAVLEAATGSSLHAAAQQLCRGFVSSSGGVRVGICGTAVPGERGMEGLREWSSLSIRIPRAIRGCADGIWKQVMEGGFQSLIIVSPPGAGKTTLLRELIRRLSDSGRRVCVANERGEIAAVRGGAPAFDVGAHTDVLTGVPKARAAGMFLRSMSPQIIAMDEITDEEDARALAQAVGCGVQLLATVHGRDREDLGTRPGLRQLLDSRAFRRCVTVEQRYGQRQYTVEGL